MSQTDAGRGVGGDRVLDKQGAQRPVEGKLFSVVQALERTGARRVTLRPFFSYYGSKWALAKHYPKPEHGLIIVWTS